jgi:hypothetical protein
MNAAKKLGLKALKVRITPERRDWKLFAHENEIPPKKLLLFCGSSTFVDEVPKLLEEL